MYELCLVTATFFHATNYDTSTTDPTCHDTYMTGTILFKSDT